jgi:hypothetical protein
MRFQLRAAVAQDYASGIARVDAGVGALRGQAAAALNMSSRRGHTANTPKTQKAPPTGRLFLDLLSYVRSDIPASGGSPWRWPFDRRALSYGPGCARVGCAVFR